MLKINVTGHEATESESECLLGLIVNNNSTWEHQLYGNTENKDCAANFPKELA